VTRPPTAPSPSLEQSIKVEARRLGFVLAGVATPDPPPHTAVFEEWLHQGRHGSMAYLADSRSRLFRADPRQLMPECRSIILLAAPYPSPRRTRRAVRQHASTEPGVRVAAYAWGRDYHDLIPVRLREIVAFIGRRVGRSVSSRCHTDTAPILERDLAQRAGLGWIGKNTCLINPKLGSYFLLAEILLDLDLKPDGPFHSDHCGTCTRCVNACPTSCILPDRTIDSRRCISYLTIELKESIPSELRLRMADWVFGCDVCQSVCPWNRFGPPKGDSAVVRGDDMLPARQLFQQLQLSSEEFTRQFKGTSIMRAKHVGYLRNLAVAAGNTAGPQAIPLLQIAARLGGTMVQEHAYWAIRQIAEREGQHE